MSSDEVNKGTAPVFDRDYFCCGRYWCGDSSRAIYQVLDAERQGTFRWRTG